MYTNLNQDPLVPLTPSMEKLMDELKSIVANPKVIEAYDEAIKNVVPIIPNDGTENEWKGKDISFFVNYFKMWFTFLPSPTGGLGKIMPFTHFYLNNKKAYDFLNTFESRQNEDQPFTKEIFNWTVKFILERGKFMDSPESLVYLNQWMEDPSTKINDFIIPEGGFKSFNEFFTRRLKPSANPRPISNSDDPSVIVASGDTEINFIQSDLLLNTPLKVKTRFINVDQLLDSSEYAKDFVGGTAISCVLMPNSYHHYHSPVTGEIIESKEVKGIYNGILDGEDWFNKGNIGESTTDFSIFEDFHRAYFIIDTKDYGKVAVIPVGLNTISSIHPSVINKRSSMVPPGAEPVSINKGDELGYFAYGGSLNIILFQKGVYSSISVLMGQRIGKMSTLKNK